MIQEDYQHKHSASASVHAHICTHLITNAGRYMQTCMYMQYAWTHTHMKRRKWLQNQAKKHKILSFPNKNILPNIEPYKKASVLKKIDVHAYHFNSLWRVMNRMNLIFSTMGSCEVLSG